MNDLPRSSRLSGPLKLLRQRNSTREGTERVRHGATGWRTDSCLAPSNCDPDRIHGGLGQSSGDARIDVDHGLTLAS